MALIDRFFECPDHIRLPGKIENEIFAAGSVRQGFELFFKGVKLAGTLISCGTDEVFVVDGGIHFGVALDDLQAFLAFEAL